MTPSGVCAKKHESRGAHGKDAQGEMMDKPATLYIAAHHEVARIENMAQLRACIGDGPDDLNWLFTGTSGIHGTCAQPWDDDLEADDDGFAEITILVIRPRTVCALYGHVRASPEDRAWLTEAARKTAQIVAARIAQ